MWCNSPIVASTKHGDLVSLLIVWRQAWYSAVISQLLTMAPIIFSAFVDGILQ